MTGKPAHRWLNSVGAGSSVRIESHSCSVELSEILFTLGVNWMRGFLWIFCVFFALVVDLQSETVQYWVDVNNTWSEQTHPGLFPNEAHFSWFGGGIHNDSIAFWKEGEVATPGMVKMAETGVTTNLFQEVESEVENGNAYVGYNIMHWFCPSEILHPSCGSLSILIEATDEFPLVTLVSMLGPSPDWFVGTSGLNLRDETGWIDQIEVDLRPYDGGTRSANQWALFGPQNDPPEPISLITTESGQLVGPDSLGTMTFRRVARGDFDANGTLDALDIDELSAEVRNGSNKSLFDLNQDSMVNQSDREEWVQQVVNTWYGDSNLDGIFDSSDFVLVFQAGKYEDEIPDNASWADGDWDGDGEFTSSDFVLAFCCGGYEGRRPRPRVAANVPEPATCWMLFAGLLAVSFSSSRKARSETKTRWNIRELSQVS